MKALAALSSMLLIAAAPAPGFADVVDSFRCTSASPQAQADIGIFKLAYERRSVAIVEAALAGDRARLAGAIAPTARFSLLRGDSGIGPRISGVNAAIAFVREIAPRSYRFALNFPGPLSTEPCGPATAELMLEGGSHGTVNATFTYGGGVLTGIESSEADVVEGHFARPKAGSPPPRG
jgi:hypothetical protein